MTQQATSPAQAPASNAQVREQIRNAIQDAQIAARDAARAGQDAARAGQDAARASGGGSNVIIGPALPPPPSFPGQYAGDQPFDGPGIPPAVVDISIAFFIMCAVMVIGWPLARAFGKRIERRSEVASVNPAMAEQLQRIEQAVDAMSIEVERISESQRFIARLQNAQSPERVGLPADRS